MARRRVVSKKRKIVKRSKLEKDRELLQLAQGYQQVQAERDAGEFIMSNNNYYTCFCTLFNFHVTRK